MEKYYCDTCLLKQDTSVLKVEKTFTHKNKTIEIEANERVCNVCHEVVYDEKLDEKMLSLAIHEYNKIYGLVGEDIISFRKKYKLSQQLFSSLLGIAKKTLISYEKEYVIPEESNASLLKLVVKDPSTLMTLSNDKHIPLEDKHIDQLSVSYVGDNKTEKENKELIKNIILFFTQYETSMTNLMKGFFYLDFSHFKRYHKSYTGMTYFKYEYGPFTTSLYQYVDELVKEGKMEKKTIDYKDTMQSLYKSNVVENNLLVSEEVVYLLDNIHKFIEENNAEIVSELSHQEDAWLKTAMYEPISYQFSKTLKYDFTENK